MFIKGVRPGYTLPTDPVLRRGRERIVFGDGVPLGEVGGETGVVVHAELKRR
jgi:hypothetical protein